MIFSIDVEDWSQSVLDNNHPISNRVLKNTNHLLDMLDDYEQKATFFVLGNVAEKHPELVKRISNKGHEVASHGYNHKSIYELTPKQVREDVSKSVNLLEDITGNKVIGFRAPDFSIREYLFEWYCEALAENGLRYDSSLFPMKVLRYGIEKEYSLKIFNKYHLNEHYLSYVKLGKSKLPFFGGSYFRMTPYFVTKLLSKQLNHERAVFYMYPYDIDTDELAALKSAYNGVPLKSQFTQFFGRDSVETKLHKLLKDFEFTSFELQYYSENSLSNPHNASNGTDNKVSHTSSKLNPNNIVANTSFES